MTLQKTHIAALALAGAFAVTAATPSFADSRWGYAAGGFAAGALVGAAAANANSGYYYGGGPYAYEPAPTYYAPRSYGYAPRAYMHSYGPTYNPENPYDPDPRIGGSFKMNSSGDD